MFVILVVFVYISHPALTGKTQVLMDTAKWSPGEQFISTGIPLEHWMNFVQSLGCFRRLLLLSQETEKTCKLLWWGTGMKETILGFRYTCILTLLKWVCVKMTTVGRFMSSLQYRFKKAKLCQDHWHGDVYSANKYHVYIVHWTCVLLYLCTCTTYKRHGFHIVHIVATTLCQHHLHYFNIMHI